MNNPETSNYFFDNIEPITHCLNICLLLSFNLSTHRITNIKFYNDKKFELDLNIEDLNDIKKIITHLEKKHSLNKESFLKNLKDLLKQLQVDHSQLTIAPEQVQLVIISDILNKNTIKHWTSLPVLGGNKDEISNYFFGVTQLANSALNNEEKIILESLLNKIIKKMLNE